MATELLVSDHDGTLTEQEPWDSAHVLGVRASMVQLICGGNLALMTWAEQEVRANPDQHGWLSGDRIIAPALANPLLLLRAMAEHICRTHGLFPDPAERSHKLEQTYRDNYRLARVPARHNAASVLQQCSEMMPVYVVTNSTAEPVQSKLQEMQWEQSGDAQVFEQLVSRVRGSAKKFELDNSLTSVPEALHVPGLARSVYVRRGHYYAVLDAILKNHGLQWRELAVIGDSLELDLALPYAMGAKIGLVVDDYTPAYERAFVAANLGRAHLIHDLSEVPRFLMG